MIRPNIIWKEFDRDDPNLINLSDHEYLIFIEDDVYDGKPMGKYDPDHEYHVDIATPFGSYLDDFWDTRNDWYEGQNLKVLAYAEIPYGLHIGDLSVDYSILYD